MSASAIDELRIKLEAFGEQQARREDAMHARLGSPWRGCQCWPCRMEKLEAEADWTAEELLEIGRCTAASRAAGLCGVPRFGGGGAAGQRRSS